MSEAAAQPPEVRRVIRLLQASTRRAQKLILEPPGRTEKTRAWNASDAAQRVAAYRRELRTLGVEVDAATGKVLSDRYRDGRRQARAELDAAGVNVAPIAGSMTAVETRRAQTLIRSARRDLGQAITSMGDTTERLVRQTNALGLNRDRVARILAGGTIEGAPKQTLERLRREMRRVAGGGLVTVVNGQTGVVTTFRPDRYADLVYQTQMAQAAEAAAHATYRQAGIDLVKVIGSNSTNFCTAFVGKIYSLSGSDKTYPAFSVLPRGGPPFHPRCTKRTVAVVPTLATPAELEAGKATPRSERYHNKSSAEAQKLYRQQAAPTAPTPPDPTPPQPVPEPDRNEQLRREAARTRESIRQIEAAIPATRERLEREIDQLAERAQAAVGVDVSDLQQAIDQRVDQLRDVEHAARAQIRAVVRVEQPIEVALTTAAELDPSRRAAAEVGARELSRLVDRRALARVEVRARLPERRSSMGTRRAYYRDGIVFLPRGVSVSTVIHEIAHAVEHRAPQILRLCREFLLRRATGPAVSLRQLTGNRRYKPTEFAFPDKFFSAYVGKDYGGQYTEILTMGLERMYADPAAFAREDPEYFDFIFAVVRGATA